MVTSELMEELFYETFVAEFSLIDFYFLGVVPHRIFEQLQTLESANTVMAPNSGIIDHMAPESCSVASRSYAAAKSISTYPFTSKEHNIRAGDPICDWYTYISYHNRVIFAVADGCNWGPAPREAAQRAVRQATSYLMAINGSLTSPLAVGFALVRAVMLAHNEIFRDKENPSDAGGTTLVVGMVIQLVGGDPDQRRQLALTCSVGDCKVFHYSFAKSRCADFVPDVRTGTDASDSGGRIGFKADGFVPDLQNMKLESAFVEPEDFFPGDVGWIA